MQASVSRAMKVPGLLFHCLSLAVTFTGFAGAAETAGSCAVDGFVVSAATGAPIPRAQVTIITSGGSYGVAADNRGRWQASGLPCGQTGIVASRPGFLQSGLGQPGLGAPFHPLALTSQAPLHELKLTLAPQGVVAGKIVDDNGDPLMNVTVTALAARVLQGRRTFQAQGSASTNDLGEYRLAGLQAGRYIVCARIQAPVGWRGDLPLEDRCLPGPVEGGTASAMELAGSTAHVDFTLAHVPAVKIRGMIAGGGGRNSPLSIYKRLPTQTVRMGIPANVSPDGSFEIHGVTPGSYELAADRWENGKRLAARIPIEVGASDLEGITVRLEPGFSLSGTVRIESKDGGSRNMRPIHLSLRSPDPSVGSGQLAWSEAGDTFTVHEMLPANYRLELSPNSPFYIQSAMLGGRDISKEEIPIAASTGAVEVILRDDGGSMQGMVQDAAGKPAAAWVMVLPAGERGFWQPRTVISGPDGRFSVNMLAPGDYNVCAWDDWQQVEYSNPEWMQRNATAVPVRVDAGKTAQVTAPQRQAPAF